MEVQETRKLRYFLTLILIGIILMYYPSYGKDPSLTPQERMENSPQCQNGKFHNAKKVLYDAGAAWRAAFKYILFSKRVDPVPQDPPPIRRLTGTDFYIQDDQALRFVRIAQNQGKRVVRCFQMRTWNVPTSNS